jgi:hypothetical protein
MSLVCAFAIETVEWRLGEMGGRSSVVEFQPSKLAVVGSNPIARSKDNVAEVVVAIWMVKAGIR